ncbi:MAG: hypothetical protein M1818_000513 [Claussenomyces sp. TS43310]|nr:MAG: hypothetical protein M1818_000513 [Claussenomyces sp. TS43310]
MALDIAPEAKILLTLLRGTRHSQRLSFSEPGHPREHPVITKNRQGVVEWREDHFRAHQSLDRAYFDTITEIWFDRIAKMGSLGSGRTTVNTEIIPGTTGCQLLGLLNTE